jgi:hypothetical protein
MSFSTEKTQSRHSSTLLDNEPLTKRNPAEAGPMAAQ